MSRGKQKINRSIIIGVTGVLALFFTLPILITAANSFMTGFEITARYSINVLPANYFDRLDVWPQIHFVRMSMAPDWVSLGQFWALFQNAEVINALWNSIFITLPVVAGQLILCVPAAYAFELCQWRHKEKLFFVYIVVMLMPLPVILVPQFVMARFLGIDESVWAVIFPALFAPFGVFLLRQYLKNVPVMLFEAAKIDGAGHMRLLASIAVPLLKPAIAALALLVFVDYWNVVDQAIVFITEPRMMPLSVLLARLTDNYQIIFATSFFYMVPALLVFLHGQEHLVSGMRMSGIK